jgi:hypothetical protein
MINDKENQNPLSYTASLNQLLNEISQNPTANIEQSTTIKQVIEEIIPSEEKLHVPILNPSILKTLPEYSMTTSEEESVSNDKSYCAFEVLRINGNESSSQALFEINYQSNHAYINSYLIFIFKE